MGALPLKIMRRNILKVAFVGVLFISLFTMIPSIIADETQWLPAGSHTGMTVIAPEQLANGARLEGDTLLGKLLFNSPSILGEKAVRIGLSCNSCHPNGHRNSDFFIPKLSSEPGTIDLTSSFWHDGGEDSLFNPIAIPTLRNIRNTAPYGHQNNILSLRRFTENVIVKEFGGPEPDIAVLDPLMSYMSLLEERKDHAHEQHQPAFVLADLLQLLKDPLHSGDWRMLDQRVGLIKETLERLLDNGNRQELSSLAKSLSALRVEAHKNKRAAINHYNSILKQYE
ncbi:MAG: hypothetical protein MI743_17685 [Sneathiellales bacterium]|nr:hypothetical protein [Sneathiellales bacterium]